METGPRQSVEWKELMDAAPEMTPQLKTLYEKKLDQPEGFVPPVIQTMLPEDILEIEKTIEAIDQQVARGIPSYAYFNKLLRKIQVLIAEQAPEFFENLPKDLQSKLLYAKIDMPTADDVEKEVFDPMDAPGGLKGGLTFDLMVQDILNYNELSTKLAEAYADYRREHLKKKKVA